MAEISQNVNIEMLEKLPDGTYKRKYPKTRADDGTTFDEHLAENATTSKKGHVQVGTNVNVSNGVISVPNASTSTRGAIQLSTSTTSTSTTLAATPSAVRLAMNRADEAFQSASDGKSSIATAITGKGVNASGSDSFSVLANKVGQINIGKKWATGIVGANKSSPATVNIDFEPGTIVVREGTSSMVAVWSTMLYSTLIFSSGGYNAAPRIESVRNNSFRINTDIAVTYEYRWVAYEK